MDYSKIFGLVMALVVEAKQDMEDKKVTISELIDLVKTAVDKLGLGDKVVIDLNKDDK